jgi:hypothetical protein
MTSVLRHKAPKGDHYNVQLTQALLKGDWADGTAGSAPNGTALSWPELIRKWGKHTGGSECHEITVVQGSGQRTAEVRC